MTININVSSEYQLVTPAEFQPGAAYIRHGYEGQGRIIFGMEHFVDEEGDTITGFDPVDGCAYTFKSTGQFREVDVTVNVHLK